MGRRNFLDYSLDEFALVVENTDIVRQLREKCHCASNVIRFAYLAVSHKFGGKLSTEKAEKYKLVDYGVSAASLGALQNVLCNTFRVDRVEKLHKSVEDFMSDVVTIGFLLEKLIKEDDNIRSVDDYTRIKRYLSTAHLVVVNEDV
ncbi:MULTISPECIES: hypothetical protein [Anoxybacillaceae]|nr:hypothetical protein [Anoxybacillus flavithermus]MBE2912957.1 hypothetical protein [Anoxybacillus flavithermus]